MPFARCRAGTLLVFGAIYAKAAQRFSQHRQHVASQEAKHEDRWGRLATA
jgi:hypothetical protein